MFPEGLTPQERAFAHAALKDAEAFAVLPNLSKTGVGVSQFRGRGVLVYRDGDGGWRLPIPLLVSGTGVGPHYAMIAFDTLAVIRSPQALQRLLAGNGAPTGREVTGVLPDTPLETDGILAYTRSRGLSGGCSQNDIHLDLDAATYQAMYDVTTGPKLLFEGRFDTCRRPFPAQKLADDVKIRSGLAPLTTIWLIPGHKAN
jgi:lipid-binding SYLF domain-containing protein